MKLNELYTHLLPMGCFYPDKDGYINVRLMGQNEPAKVKGKRLVMPTNAQLSQPGWDNRVVFHPMPENPLRGESDVLQEFRKGINIRLNTTFSLLAHHLLRIATSTADHSKLSPDQAEFLSKLKNADEKTLTTFEKIMEEMPIGTPSKAFVSIFLKRGGQVEGVKYSRAGVVNFPLYNDLKALETNSVGEIHGVKVRVKDREVYIALLEYMVPGIARLHYHNRGSSSMLAPFLDALMKATLTVAGPLNDLIELFRKHLNDADDLAFDDGWVEAFNDIDKMTMEARLVPPQAGNEGTSTKGDIETTTTPPVPVPGFPMAVAPPAPQQMHQPTQQHQQPMHQGQPHPVTVHQVPGQQPMPYGYPQAPQYQQPMYQAPAPATAVHTGRGLDFGSVIRSNPALAHQVGGFGGPGPMNAPQGRPSTYGAPGSGNWQATRQGYQAPAAYGGYQQPVNNYGQQGGYSPVGSGGNYNNTPGYSRF